MTGPKGSSLPPAPGQVMRGQHLGPGLCSQPSPKTQGDGEHLAVQVFTWLARLPDPLPAVSAKKVSRLSAHFSPAACNSGNGKRSSAVPSSDGHTEQFLTDPSILNMAGGATVHRAHGASGDETGLDLPPPPARGGNDRCAAAAAGAGPALQRASGNAVWLEPAVQGVAMEKEVRQRLETHLKGPVWS